MRSEQFAVLTSGIATPQNVVLKSLRLIRDSGFKHTLFRVDSSPLVGHHYIECVVSVSDYYKIDYGDTVSIESSAPDGDFVSTISMDSCMLVSKGDPFESGEDVAMNFRVNSPAIIKVEKKH